MLSACRLWQAYGMGGKGETTLLLILLTCAPSMAVINMDNEIGGGAIAG